MFQPSIEDADVASVGPAKFYCGRKHKFGLNCQAICDARGSFLDISIKYPGATSNVLAFEGATIYQRLKDGLLTPGMLFISFLWQQPYRTNQHRQIQVCVYLETTRTSIHHSWQHRTV
jgi:DDE superfamily endonuclease